MSQVNMSKLRASRQVRKFASSSVRSQQGRADGEKPPTSPVAKEKRLARDFFLSVLSTTATKRDAKAYLQRFQTVPSLLPKLAGSAPQEGKRPNAELKESRILAPQSRINGVNLGRLYNYPKVIEETPLFSQQIVPDNYVDQKVEPLHLAIVKVRQPQSLLDSVLDGVGLTLTQLSRLGLHSIVVVDCQNNFSDKLPTRAQMSAQAERLAIVVQKHNPRGARIVEQAITWQSRECDVPARIRLNINVQVSVPRLLFQPLRQGVIPIVPALAYSAESQIKPVHADDVVLALAKAFTGLDEATASANSLSYANASTTVDRIIVLDPIGGIPKVGTHEDSHVFINLEQEYHEIRDQQSAMNRQQVSLYSGSTNRESSSDQNRAAEIDGTRKYSVSDQEAGLLLQPQLMTPSDFDRRIQNLDLAHHALALLPPASSALITTPEDAANSAQSPNSNNVLGVGTRLKRNPLIHNLLTDRPVVSSSLPSARVETGRARIKAIEAVPPSFLKRGMPLTLVPDPRSNKWTPPLPGSPPLRLESDPRVDFPRLVHLIEDSFGRKLDVKHYLKRIEGTLAGLIVAGQYEGAAILTWEKPSSASTSAPVPYLDKFAVLRKSQGSGGVADILFNAMVRTCLPDGVVWRSRTNNPVNKWYFERATGTFKLPNSQWCMFWTGEVDWDSRWRDYVSVCEGIQPSWADTRPR